MTRIKLLEKKVKKSILFVQVELDKAKQRVEQLEMLLTDLEDGAELPEEDNF